MDNLIDIKELRIGNYCTLDYPIINNIIQVSAYHILELQKKEITLLPIIITKKWLLEFGFKKGKNNWYSITYFTDCKESVEEMKIDYNIVSNRLAVYDAIEETDMVNILSHPIYTAKKVLYVHKLQNICYSLTEKELSSKANN